MTDNSSLPVASGNETFANNDIGGVKYPANDTDVASGKAMPVQLRSATGLIPGGEPTDAANANTDTTSVSWTSLFKQISKSVQTNPVARWLAGSGQGLTWGALFSSTANTDINQTTPIPTANCMLSTITISNGTGLDKYMDISIRCAISSSTIAAGANFAIYLYALLDDGSTYGTGELTAGTTSALLPPIPPAAIFPLRAAATQTTLVGFAQGIVLPPGTFKAVFQNNSGFTLNATGNVCQYRTYN